MNENNSYYQPFQDEEDQISQNQNFHNQHFQNEQNLMGQNQLRLQQRESSFLNQLQQQLKQEYDLKPHQIPVLQMLLQSELQQECALFLILSENVQTETQALELLVTDENDLFNHQFLPDPMYNIDDLNEKCRICTFPKKIHKKNSNQDIQQSLLLINKIKEQINKHGKNNYQYIEFQECMICQENVDKNKFLYIKEICHDICLDCFKQYLNNEIMVAKVCQMQCPHCMEVLDEETIKQYVDNVTFEKFTRFLRNNMIQQDPLSRWCPNINCKNVIKLKHKYEEETQCNVCNVKICLECNRIQHKNLTCQQVLDIEIKQIIDQKDIQRCANCKTLVEKITGCNVIKCDVCHYEFCWVCGSEFTPLHYAPFNPFGCPMLMSERYGKMGKCKIILYKALFLLLFLILLPILFIIVGPFLMYQYREFKSQVNQWNQTQGKRIMSIIGFIFLGILLDPFIWILVVLGFLPAIIYLYKVNKTHRLNLKQRVEQKLQQFNQQQLEKQQKQFRSGMKRISLNENQYNSNAIPDKSTSMFLNTQQNQHQQQSFMNYLFCDNQNSQQKNYNSTQIIENQENNINNNGIYNQNNISIANTNAYTQIYYNNNNCIQLGSVHKIQSPDNNNKKDQNKMYIQDSDDQLNDSENNIQQQNNPYLYINQGVINEQSLENQQQKIPVTFQDVASASAYKNK